MYMLRIGDSELCARKTTAVADISIFIHPLPHPRFSSFSHPLFACWTLQITRGGGGQSR